MLGDNRRIGGGCLIYKLMGFLVSNRYKYDIIHIKMIGSEILGN